MALDELASEGLVKFARSVTLYELPRLFTAIAFERMEVDYSLETQTRIGHGYVPHAARVDLIPDVYSADVQGNIRSGPRAVDFALEDCDPVDTPAREIPAFDGLRFRPSGPCVQPYSPEQLDIMGSVQKIVTEYFKKNPSRPNLFPQ